MISSNIQHALPIGMLFLGLMSPGAGALDWKIDPSVSATATATDNGGQTTSSDGSLILSVTPAVSVRSKGSRRVQANLNYSLSAVERFGESNDSNDLNHSLSALGKVELAEDLFFVEGTASISQALQSLLGAPGDSTLDTGNRTTVGTYSLSPYLTKRFGTFGTGLVRYRRTGALFESGVGGDIVSDSIEAGFNSGSQFKDLSWGLNYSLRESSTQNEADNRFEHYSASLGYALSRTLRLNGMAGYDKNDYLSSSGTSGQSWSVGATWAPGRRTTLDASFGERYFGNTYGLGFTHRTRSTQWNIHYSEDVSDISQQLLTETSGAFWICPEGSTSLNDLYVTPDLDPPPGRANCSDPITFTQVRDLFRLLGASELDLLRLGFNNLSSFNGVYVIKSLRGGMTWSKGKVSAGLNVYDTRRSYQQLLSDAEDQTRGVSGSMSYRLGPHTTMTGSLSFDNNQVPAVLSGLGGDRDDDIYGFSLGATHQFQPKLNGSLNYRHQQRKSSDSATADFSENSLTATVSMRF